MLGRVHQRERHCQHIREQERTPPTPDAPPQERRHHRGHACMQRRDSRHQVHAGLPRVDQRARRLQMQRAPAAGGDPLHEVVGAGVAGMHRTEQPAVGNTRRAAEHAPGVRRAARDVGGGAFRGRPWRRGRQQDVADQRGEGQHQESPDECRPVVAVAQPQEPGDRIRQDEKRHVHRADAHFPPRRMRHLEVFLQPHRRHHAEEQPAVHLWLQLPQGGRPDQGRCTPAEVVEQQDQGERQPVADDRQHFPAAADAGGDQPRRDVEQQQFTVERQPRREAAVDHHQQPHRHGAAPKQRQTVFASFRGVTGRFDGCFKR